MSTLYIGRQGSGKTTEIARHILTKFKRYPDRAFFLLDWTGALSKEILAQIGRDPDRDELLKNVVYDEPGNSEWVIPFPAFSHMYGGDPDEQASIIAHDFQDLGKELVQNAPVLGGIGLREIAPKLFRLLQAIPNNEYGRSTWQLTEARKLIKDYTLLGIKLKEHNYYIPQVEEYFKEQYIRVDKKENDLRTYVLVSLLGIIDTPTIRARFGLPEPLWTPREKMKNGGMVIVNGIKINNNKNVANFVFTHVMSQILAELKRREPDDPSASRVMIVMDELYSHLSNPYMAETIASLAPQYRNRKLELYIVIQALNQLSDELAEGIWNMGNIVCFPLLDFNDAYKIAQQLFYYDPHAVKYTHKTETQQDTTEPDRGQFLEWSNRIRSLRDREAIVRRFMSEKRLDPYLRHVIKTPEVDQTPVNVEAIKLELLKRGVRLEVALETIDRRIQKQGYDPNLKIHPK